MAQKLQRTAEHNLQSFGQAGFDIIAGASGVVTVTGGDWVAVTAVGGSDCKCALTTTVGDSFSASGFPAGAKIKIASGQVIYGQFTAIQIAANQAGNYLLAYRRVV